MIESLQDGQMTGTQSFSYAWHCWVTWGWVWLDGAGTELDELVGIRTHLWAHDLNIYYQRQWTWGQNLPLASGQTLATHRFLLQLLLFPHQKEVGTVKWEPFERSLAQEEETTKSRLHDSLWCSGQTSVRSSLGTLDPAMEVIYQAQWRSTEHISFWH